MTELPPELLPSDGLNSRIRVMPAAVASHRYGSYADYSHSPFVSSPLPPPYPPHHQPLSAFAPTTKGALYASPPSTLSPPSADFHAGSLPSTFARSPSPSQFTYPAPQHPFDGSGLQRSSSLSPPTTLGRNGLPPTSQSGPPLAAAVGTSLSRSVSADAAAPQQTSVHLVQRLSQQNTLIRDAWEAERNYLEANRRRAEEVYQEERAIMEDVREGWENDKAAMLQEIQIYKERIQRLEGENATLKAVAAQSVQLSGVVSPLSNLHGASRAGSKDSSSASSGFAAHRLSARPSQQNLSAILESDSLPPGLDGASRRPHFFASPGGSRMSPSSQSDISPFVSLESRVQPETSSKDFLSSPSEDADTPIPVIDVQEIDPKLEGIPIKATAVQRSTFAELSNKSSPATSPPAIKKSRVEPPPGLVKRASSKENTIQVLAAAESRRLTMHAGHTPNHSLSLFPGLSTRGGSTAGRSEGTTPTAASFSGPPEEQHDNKLGEVAENGGNGQVEPGIPPSDEFGEPEAILEPTDDVPLKGPLMVKNIPAQDEIFWEQVNKKLESISQDQNSLPTVMQGSLDELEAVAGPSGIDILGERAGLVVAAVGGDASQDPQTTRDDRNDPIGGKPVERDLPLKLRTTTNFGAPFGVM